MNEPPANPKRYRFTPFATQHIEHSQDWIRRAASEVPGGSVLVLGAGPCLDIPLAELLNRFDRIVLNDFDAALLNQALSGLPTDADRERIELAVCDLTSPDELLRAVDAIIAGANDPAEALELMSLAANAFDVRPAPLAGNYDLVVASCLLSQLHVMTVQSMLAKFRQRFARDVEGLDETPSWKAALYGLARRMEQQFIDQLSEWMKPAGRCFLSETVQLCHVELAADGMWETPGTFRLTKSVDLKDYLDERFEIIDQARWQRLDAPPTADSQGRLFEVHALILARKAAPAVKQPKTG